MRLIASGNNEVELGDIVKAENKVTNATFYYLYSKRFLYRYDKNGNIEEDSFNNIRVDDSISLVNDDTWTWTKLGQKNEVYDLIFK